MAIANFEELCGAFCEMAGIEKPRLVRGGHGWSAFTVRMQDVLVTALQVQECTDTFYLLAELGPMPEERAVDGWLTLLKFNMPMHVQELPVFSRNPATGEVVLHQPLRLWDASPTDLFERVELLVEMALVWRQTLFMHEVSAEDARSTQPALFEALA